MKNIDVKLNKYFTLDFPYNANYFLTYQEDRDN